MTIKFYRKSVYGNEMIYAADDNVRKILTNLTGKKTLNSGDILLLRMLGHECQEVLQPNKELAYA